MVAETAVNGHAVAQTSTKSNGASPAHDGLRLPTFSAPLPHHKPYVLESEEGETVTIIGSGSIMRYLTTGKETEDAFAIVQTRARPDVPVPPHFHRNAHDTWIVTKGSIKLWCNDQCRILGPGDFGSVPPGNTHSFQVIGEDTDFIGIISPGSWIKMFKYIAEPYTDGPTFPWSDSRAFPVPLFIEAIKAGEDVVPQREFKLCEPQPWTEADQQIPSDTKPYFLKSSTGPQYFLNSQSCAPLARTRNTNDRFAVSVISGVGPKSKYGRFKGTRDENEQGPFAGDKKSLRFEKTNSLFRAIEGKIQFTLQTEAGEVEDVLTANESILVPAGTAFRYTIKSAYARMYAFSGEGEGIEEVFVASGREGTARETVGELEDQVVREIVLSGVKAELV